MKNDRIETEQLVLDFDRALTVSQGTCGRAVAESSMKRLSLVVNNAAGSCAVAALPELRPDSPEITQIILSLGKSLSW